MEYKIGALYSSYYNFFPRLEELGWSKKCTSESHLRNHALCFSCAAADLFPRLLVAICFYSNWIQWYCGLVYMPAYPSVHMFHDQPGLKIELKAGDAQPIEDGALRGFVFRGVQALSYPTVRHAVVKSARTAFSRAVGDLAVPAGDEGPLIESRPVGIERQASWIGLLNLRERASILGAS